MERNYGIDKIRVLLTLLVIFHHVAIVYGGAGGWFWVEEPAGSNFSLTMFVAVNQSFFMGFFFLLAGYYSAFSLSRKDMHIFLKDRVIRLGIPLLVFIFFIHPFSVALYYPDISPSIFMRTLILMQNGSFGSGPLWFLSALLVFSVLSILLFKLNKNTLPTLHSPLSIPLIATIIMVIGTLNFLVRIEYPIDRTFLGMTLGHFPAYIVLFFGGIACANKKLIERITAQQVIPFLLLSVFAIATHPAIVKAVPGETSGGISPMGAYFAFWEPMTGMGIILGLLWIFTKHLGGAATIWQFLGKHAYGTYIVHAPAVIFTTYTMRNLGEPALTKFILASILSTLLSVAIATLLLKLPYAKKVL